MSDTRVPRVGSPRFSPEFEDTVGRVLYRIRQYGADQSGGVPSPEDSSQFLRFISNVHKGFNLGQDLVLQALLDNDEHKRKAKTDLKRAHAAGHTERAQKLKSRLSTLDYEEAVFRTLANSTIQTINTPKFLTFSTFH